MTFTVPSCYINALLTMAPHLPFPPLWREARAEDVSTAAGRGESLSCAGTAVHTGSVDRLHGLHASATEVVHLVRQTVSTPVQETGRVVCETVTVGRDVVTGTLQAAADGGMGLMTSTTPGTQGLVRGVRDVGGDLLPVAPRAVQGTVAATA